MDAPFTERPDPKTATVGELIRWHRLNTKLPDGSYSSTPQLDLAAHLHVSHAYLSLIESGRRRLPDPGPLHAVAEYLGLDPAEKEILFERWNAEARSVRDRRLARLGHSKTELVRGIPLDAVRILLDTNPTARAAIEAWIERLPVPRATTKPHDNAQRKKRGAR